MNARRNYRRNAVMSVHGVTGILERGTYVAAGAVLSRWLTQMVLGASNTGFMGYIGNAVAGGVISFAADSFRRGSGEFILYGTAAGIVQRFLQDQTPLGKYFNLSGVDSGMGAIIPYNGTQPAIYTGTNAMVQIPRGWGAPATLPAASAVPASAAGQVVRTAGGMGAPVGRGLYSTGGGRGLYRPA